MDTTVERKSFTQRINWRIIVFAIAMVLPVGALLYTFLDEVVTGGVHDRGGYLEVDLKAMSNFEMDQFTATSQDIPEQWRKLDGKRVMMLGEMWEASDAGGKVGKFQLVYSIAKCCFSGPPKAQHFVDCAVVKDKRVGFYQNLVRVVGTIHIGVKHDGEKIRSVYQVDVESVEPVT
jgi:hypothetical protein